MVRVRQATLSKSKTKVKPKVNAAKAKPRNGGVQFKQKPKLRGQAAAANAALKSKAKSKSIQNPNPVKGTPSSSKPSATNSFNNGRDTNTKSVAEASSKTLLDKSTINFPYDVRISGVSSLWSTIQKSTPKVKKILLDECDVILECRYCKNLFRSMPNFLCHKQTFCKTSLSSSPESSSLQLIQRTRQTVKFSFGTSGKESMPPSTSTSSSGSENLMESFVADAGRMVKEEDSSTRSPLSYYTQISQATTAPAAPSAETNNETVSIVLEPVKDRSDGVMFQRKSNIPDTSICDSSAEASDHREVLDRDTAILGPDGRVMCTGTARGIEKIVRHLTAQIEITQSKMVQNSTNGFPETCDICKTVFTTEKAFRQHRRDAPDCVRQSTSKVINGGSVGKSSGSIDLIGESKQTPNEDNTSKEELSRRKSLVKKLFSPIKSAAMIEQSPLKSPMSTKKLLALNSPKLSPYKKSLAKAVKQFRLPEETSTESSFSKYSFSDASRNSASRRFDCIRCCRRFNSTSEMSMHLVRCSQMMNVRAEDIKTNPEKAPKITIEVRNHYLKPDESKRVKLLSSSSVIPEQERTIPGSMSIIQHADKVKVGARKNSETSTCDIADNSKLVQELPSSLLSPTPTPAKSSAKNNSLNRTASHVTGDEVETETVRSNESLQLKVQERLGTKRKGEYYEFSKDSETTEPNNNLSSSESEGDRESIRTDSGISSVSTTAGSEDPPESQVDSAESAINSDVDNPPASSRAGIRRAKLRKAVAESNTKEGITSPLNGSLLTKSSSLSPNRKSYRIKSKGTKTSDAPVSTALAKRNN